MTLVAPIPTLTQQDALGPSTVLIVDDERQNRDVLEIMLNAEGFVVRSADSGESALELIAAAPPDLIVLDIMMPGMDGYQVTERLKGNDVTRRIPIIVLTSLNDQESRTRALAAGAEECLSKPVNQVAQKIGIDRDVRFVQKPFTGSELLRRVRDALQN